ncbi:hypothetical protein ACFSQT_12715 [Mesorhizobium calcicola]|uniref:Uncharacterized protein n=1 Tax=Mesorhizobium calcicola TaxID=1300310 RepID=A0ABW4WCN3_9HYPH
MKVLKIFNGVAPAPDGNTLARIPWEVSEKMGQAGDGAYVSDIHVDTPSA